MVSLFYFFLNKSIDFALAIWYNGIMIVGDNKWIINIKENKCLEKG